MDTTKEVLREFVQKRAAQILTRQMLADYEQTGEIGNVNIDAAVEQAIAELRINLKAYQLWLEEQKKPEGCRGYNSLESCEGCDDCA